jgi:Flp pilus assembly protein TadD
MANQTRMQQIQEMLAQEPNDPMLRYMVAMEHVSQGDDESAVRCFRELIGLAPQYIPAYMQAGQALVRLNRSDDARPVFEQGIAAAERGHDQHALEEMRAMLAELD